VRGCHRRAAEEEVVGLAAAGLVRSDDPRAGSCDVEVLARHFLNQFALEIPAFRDRRLSAEALARLNRYRFPGNVRELKNIIERAAYRDSGREISLEDLGLIFNDDAGSRRGTLHEKVEAYRRRLIADALKEAGGNQARAARLLGISYHQFRYFHRKRRT